MNLIMKDCYRRNNQKYDWLIFYELDEFIHLRNYTNIKSFLKPKFENFQLLYLNLVCHTDNNKLYYENNPLSERFPEIAPITKFLGKYLEVKSIIKGNISEARINHSHLLDKRLRNWTGYVNWNKVFNDHFSSEPDYTHYYIDHYYSKSTEEFINKLNRGDEFSTATSY